MTDTTSTADDVSSIERSVKPYRGRFPTYDRIPAHGRPRDEVFAELEQMLDEERSRWSDGFASGSVYHGPIETRPLPTSRRSGSSASGRTAR